MAYVCGKCGKKIKSFDTFTRCTYCGHRVLIKERPNIAKEVPTD